MATRKPATTAKERVLSPPKFLNVSSFDVVQPEHILGNTLASRLKVLVFFFLTLVSKSVYLSPCDTGVGFAMTTRAQYGFCRLFSS
jgi:hypothetical protein